MSRIRVKNQSPQKLPTDEAFRPHPICVTEMEMRGRHEELIPRMHPVRTVHVASFGSQGPSIPTLYMCPIRWCLRIKM